MRLINEDDVLEIIEHVTNEAVEKNQRKYLIQPRIIAEISDLPTIEAEPDKGWISVKDKPPKPKTWVMVYIEYPSPVFEIERGIQKMSSIKKMFYDGKSFYCDFGTVTHWQTLPKPPKGE